MGPQEAGLGAGGGRGFGWSPECTPSPRRGAGSSVGRQASTSDCAPGLPDPALVGGHGLGHVHPAAAGRLPVSCPPLHQPHHLQVRRGHRGWGRLVQHWCGPPLHPSLVHPALCDGWVLGAKRAPPLSQPWALRVLCACSEEVPLRAGPEDLQELDSLDTENSPLCSPSGGYGPAAGWAGPAAGWAGRRGVLGQQLGGWTPSWGTPGHWLTAGRGLLCDAGRRSRPRPRGLQPAEAHVWPSCSRAGASSGVRL